MAFYLSPGGGGAQCAFYLGGGGVVSPALEFPREFPEPLSRPQPRQNIKNISSTGLAEQEGEKEVYLDKKDGVLTGKTGF